MGWNHQLVLPFGVFFWWSSSFKTVNCLSSGSDWLLDVGEKVPSRSEWLTKTRRSIIHLFLNYIAMIFGSHFWIPQSIHLILGFTAQVFFLCPIGALSRRLQTQRCLPLVCFLAGSEGFQWPSQWPFMKSEACYANPVKSPGNDVIWWLFISNEFEFPNRPGPNSETHTLYVGTWSMMDNQ